MIIHYDCDNCGQPIDTVEVDAVDEARFGFDCLTTEERQDLVRYDAEGGAMYVKSLCDACIEAMGLPGTAAPPQGWLH